VFPAVSDPVENGLVASLARPGGNVTGFSPFQFELMPKRLELLTELVPQARVIALLVNPNDPRAEGLIRDMRETARTKGVQLPILKGRHRERDRRRFHDPRRAAGRRAPRLPRSIIP
jgi:putative ABC transport system substrate-binding protein